MIELQQEGFKIYRRPKHNKKERRHLGLPKDREVMIEVAAGFFTHKGTRRYIVRTAEIVASDFDRDSGYMTFSTSNGKDYRVPYKEPEKR